MRSTQQPPTGAGSGTRRRPTRRLIVSLVITLVALTAAAVTLTVFQPQRLFIDERIDEAAPAAPVTSERGPSADDGPAQPQPEVSRQGSFRGLDHQAEGTALMLRLQDGQQVLRLERLNVENGPDLYVYLSAAAADGPASAHDDDFVSLGRLKGNQGNQNYELPDGVDPDRYRSAVIWCQRFAVGFAAASLS